MRRPVVAAMSGISLAVLGLSFHASQRTAPAAAGAAPAGLVLPPAQQTAQPSRRPVGQPTAPSAVASVVQARKSAPATSRPTAAPTHRASAAPAKTSEAPAAPRSSPPAASKAPSAAPKPSASTVVVNGSPADTQYGPVQVQITLRGGHIVKADAIDYPQGSGRDQEINSQAIPQLDQEAVQADSSQIDAVSGATYTSAGYRQSLQSALDAAHRAGAR